MRALIGSSTVQVAEVTEQKKISCLFLATISRADLNNQFKTNGPKCLKLEVTYYLKYGIFFLLSFSIG